MKRPERYWRTTGISWLELVIGIILIALGILVFTKPDLALTGMIVVYGMAAVVMGVADIILYIQVERYTGLGPVLSLTAGIMSVMSGIMLVAYPRAGVMVLTVLFPIWFIAHCVSRLMHVNHIRFVAGSEIYYFVLIVNIIGLILGMLMILSPGFTLTTLRYLAGSYLVLLGIDSIVMAVSRMGKRM